MSIHAAVLIGSPKGSASTSDALGTYLLERLREKDVDVSKIYVQQSLRSEQGLDNLFRAVAKANVVILVAPVYADSYHSGVVKAMELIREEVRTRTIVGKRMMVAISNCGFPESRHNELSLAISRRFAMECGFEWGGGLALGGGESIGGRQLEKAGRLVRNVRKSLDIAADALARGKQIPEEAVKLMARPLIPRWFYLLVGNIGWRRRAKKQGCKDRLDIRPYRNRQ